MIWFLLLCTVGSSFGYWYYQPEQIHIAYGEKANDIVVTWTTFDDPEESIVQYGEGTMDLEATGTRVRFQEPEKKNVQFIHRVLLPDLNYNTSYIYHCGSKLFGWSSLFSFKTVPKDEDWVVRALIFGDLGNQNAVTLPYLQDEVQRGKYDLMLHVGDIAYDLNEEGGKVGDLFMNQMQPLAATVPYMTCPGNHEKAANFTQYRNRFTMPNYKATESLYYSFNVGPIHFVAVDIELYYSTKYGVELANYQYEWLKRDLEEANRPENRTKRPWIITFGHKPMVCSNDSEQDCLAFGLHMPQRVGDKYQKICGLEPLLRDFGVDIAIWAHEHSYERMWPMFDLKVYNGTKSAYVNPRAPVHITTGSAGCREGVDKFVKNPMPWSAFRSSDQSYTSLYAHNKTHIYIEQWAVKKDKFGKKLIDSYWIEQHEHKPFTHLPQTRGMEHQCYLNYTPPTHKNTKSDRNKQVAENINLDVTNHVGEL